MAEQDNTNNYLNTHAQALKAGQAVTPTHRGIAGDIDELDSALTGAGYSAAELLKMTKNDKVYAYRNLPANASAIGNGA